jgi:hypothetical protein
MPNQGTPKPPPPEPMPDKGTHKQPPPEPMPGKGAHNQPPPEPMPNQDTPDQPTPDQPTPHAMPQCRSPHHNQFSFLAAFGQILPAKRRSISLHL